MLQKFCDNILKQLTAFLEKYWQQKTIICAILAVLFFSGQDVQKIKQFFDKHPIYPYLNKQIASPLTSQPHSPELHLSKRSFRLFMPVIAKIFRLTPTGLFLLQYIFGVLFFYFLSQFAFKYSGDKVITFLFTVGFSGIYAGKSFFVDYWSFFDGTAFLFLLLSIRYAQPWIIFFTLTFAFWTDERAVVASLSVLTFHLIQLNGSPESKKFKLFHPTILTIVSSFTFYGLIRWFLHTNYHLATGTEGIGLAWSISKFLRHMPMATFLFLESYWLLIPLAIIGLYAQTFKFRYTILALISISVLTQLATALAVGDMIRSGSYLLIAVCTSFFLINLTEKSLFGKRCIFLFTCVTAFIIPSYSNFGGYFIWLKPDWLFHFLT